MTPEQIQARVLYRDGLMLIIDKPAGLPVHAGPGGGPNLERHFDALRFGFPKPPGLAHRLDRDTSGCLILGRHPKALRKLGKLFQDGKVDKTYWAVVAGTPPEEQGRIELPLKKVTNKSGGWRIVVADDGQSAITDYRVLGRGNGTTWLELKPHTGRTHQIRVHCATALGCPLLGDPQYGGPEGHPLHLQSRAISLPLYPSREAVGAVAPVPLHMRAALAACGFQGDDPA
ncbi:RNA pseudouridine synthase [Azospirillum baldaniorum]|uniref:Pseudouridine synthase n=1 Tax=Azospirillum baldaniorum TaxID=1064539 RepID=A0A9P1JR44_9PROT|nr:RNA pseudouridine synthase [Azospirillum baldaniorum]TWA75442.1 tRNA pseudouridine32 synthase/23S rRNA pseudouridine746 synthase/23S rRNA pseudouridine1911/1915/1917 synthase [Azospirillum brasilense]AWJ89875.1 RNA pseudouridine synthase [Azospirillum baldaniorum]NUB10128.1 RNA pseudouridine synthase [Azospirillum baldaniorum]TWA59650.1 tRNA pseudouridine32 synthase/23S rRNA pseudouridine746 synthase/23S rRNA pseudouridine1911/1915/1917 synthase [Azospirillum baldaniorum]CCC98114.1 Pseudour